MMLATKRTASRIAGAFLLLALVLMNLNTAYAAAPAASDSGQAILDGNPGFETGALEPWTTQNNAKVVAGNAHSGTYAADLGGAYSGVQQTVTGLKPNTFYTLTAWVKTERDLIYLGAKNFAGSGSEVNTTTTSPAYTKVSVSFMTDSKTTSAYIFLWKNDNTGTSYADDITLTASPVRTYSGQNIGFNTQDPYFVSSDSLNKLYDKVASTGTKWVRVTLFWDLMEPTEGKFDWKKADSIFKTIKAKGLKADVVIRSAPSWAAGGADTSLHNYAPTNGKAYGEFCYQVAKRYLRRGIKIAFELGNEENMQFFNEPKVDPAQYTKNMLIPGSIGIRLAARQLHVPAPTIMVGGFAPVEPKYVPGSIAPLDFMKAIYDNGGKGYFDSIAYHPYTYVSPPTSSHWTFTELQSIIDLMNSMGDTNRKVWATEAGWATGTGGGEVSETAQAAFTGEFFDLWFSLPYAGPVMWYELADNKSYDNTNRENTFGLLHSDANGSPKPAYKIFLSKISVPVSGISLSARHLNLRVGSPGYQLHAVVTPDNATDQSVTWTSSDPNTAKVSADGVVTAVSKGLAVITASAGGQRAHVIVEVRRNK